MSFPVRKTLKGRRAVVIGSGPGGLAAAISLAVRGARVVVLEKSPEVGGSLRPLRLGDYRFDPWPFQVTRPDVLAELFASAGHRLTDFLTLERPDSLCRFHLQDGRKINFYHDISRLSEEISVFDPEDARRLRGFFQRSAAIAAAFESYNRRRPFAGVGTALEWPVWAAMPLLLNPKSDGTLILSTFRNPQVRDFLLSMRALLPRSPFCGRRLYMQKVGEFQQTGGWEVVGGMEQLLQPLLRLCEILGIRIAKKADVQRIELRDGRVRSVSGTGFKPLSASIVVSNTDSADTIRDLLPKSEQPRREFTSLEKLHRSHSRYVLLLGVKKTWPDLAHLNVFISHDVREESRFIDKWRLPATSGTMVVRNSQAADPTAAPAGATALSVRVEMPAASSRFLWSEAHAEEERVRILTALQARGMGDVEEHAEVQEYSSPVAASRGEMLNFSAATGYAMRNARDLTRLPVGRVSQAHGLYLAGPTTHPGAGIAEEILSGLITGVSAANDAG